MTNDIAPADVPEEFLAPEGDAELQDPELMFEATTSSLRRMWADWMCKKGSGTYSDPKIFGQTIGTVPTVAVDAFKALEAAITAAGFKPKARAWAYNCRKIGGSNNYSLHSAGIAIDIDPKDNPYTHGDRYSGTIKEPHVRAVLAIKNSAGKSVWSWGGNWSKPDRMHFQLDQAPNAVDVDWSTVPGGGAAAAITNDEEGQVLTTDSGGKAVVHFQNALLTWKPDSLPKYGADGDYGNETITAVKAFQKEYGLEETGNIDGVTAVLLSGASDT